MDDQSTQGRVCQQAGHEMKICDATKIFAEYGDDFRPDLESLVALVRSSNLGEPLQNSNYLHALSLTEMMFLHTRQSFKMMTGSAVDGFLTCLKDSFFEMLSRVASTGGTAKMILVHEDQQEREEVSPTIREAASRFPEHFKTIEVNLKPGTKITHFIVCDDDMVRDEEWHPPLKSTSSANEVKAKVFFKNKAVAGSFNSRFDTIWDVLSK